MKIRCEVVLDYGDAKTAQMVLRSTQVDNFDFVRSTVQGKRLTAVMESTSVSALIHTLDDYLACVSVAEKVVDKS